jgi:hypothetical protein
MEQNKPQSPAKIGNSAEKIPRTLAGLKQDPILKYESTKSTSYSTTYTT